MQPSVHMWLIALIGLALPWIAIPLGIAGLMLGLRGEPIGWPLLATAAALLILDIAIDVYWAHPAVSRSDEPDLNRRGNQLIGRIATVIEPIETGRGKVRVGDTVWAVEGPHAIAGDQVEVVGADGAVLQVNLVGRDNPTP